MNSVCLKSQQQQFTRYLRDPEGHDAPSDIETRRMIIYRDLFFNNIENFISSAFPVFRSLFCEEEWLALVRNFFSVHKAKTPYFLEISEEFLSYLNASESGIHQRFPFAKELCHYEWLELALDIADDDSIDPAMINPVGDFTSQPIILSPFIWAQAYAWPVHEIGVNNIPEQISASPNCLLVYRTEDFSIEFMQINPATIRLLELIDEHSELSGEGVIALLANELSQSLTPSFTQFALETLEKLRSEGIVLGTSSL